ncbi:uncharacterized protein LOC132195398 isoform X2 [Neocloeon triangulifer]|uniref:uncharacterized protein LOC132195398 isoform X2 n=1 Tax=Neocloeon triangulifer TaxID=2078957 RepID=UPI00286F0560|nr:uncharacterized protein LOC132195398 isoform X2 [Neocloeon triangulifer]
MAHFWSSTASLVFSLILIINDTVKTETDSPATTEIESLLLQPWQEDLYEGELDKHPYCRCLSDGLQGWIVECDCGRDFPGILNFSFPAKLPYKTAAVRIKNCDMVEISKGDILRGQPYVPLEVLSITSIVLLKLHPGLVMDSNLILISQIVNIKAIPKGILGQTVEHFIIRSATVTTVEKGAFDHADFLKNFGLHNTKIWYIDGEILKVNAPDAIIYISNTSLGELNNARMDLLGKSVTLRYIMSRTMNSVLWRSMVLICLAKRHSLLKITSSCFKKMHY